MADPGFLHVEGANPVFANFSKKKNNIKLRTIFRYIGSGGSKGGARGTRPPRGPRFFQFHAVFGKIWQNRMLAPPLGSWRPLLGEILDPPLIGSRLQRVIQFTKICSL